ncbi:MAG: hypothetical protein AAFV96_14300 [Pseudomonadota bacterium]
MSPPKVLFVCYGGGHAAMVAPVVQALVNEAPDVRVEVMGPTTARGILTRAGIPFFGYSDILDPAADAEAYAQGARLAAGHHAPHTGIPEQETQAYLGQNYVELIAEEGTEAAAARFAAMGRRAFLPMTMMARVIDQMAPDLVVTTPSPRSELAARRVAAARGIPSLVIADIIGAPGFPPNEMIADHITVPAASAAKGYDRYDYVRAGQYHVTGNPAMDALAVSVRPDRAEARAALGLPGVGQAVLLAEPAARLDAAAAVVPLGEAERMALLSRQHRAVRAAGAVTVIRPHPSLDPGPYAAFADTVPDAVLAAEAPLMTVLSTVDLVVSNSSTLMMDALHAGVTVLQTRFPDSAVSLPFDDMGFALGTPIDDEAALTSAMKTALSDADAAAARLERFRADFPPPPAAPRIAALVRAILEGRV